jgi:hypothetical protein
MLTMATDERTRHYFQTFQRLKNQYTAWAANMRATATYASRQGHTSNDAIGNALFMWAREQDPEKLAKLLEPYLNQWQEMWDAREGAAEATGQPWLPGSVRDQTPLLDPPKPRKPSHVNETRVDPDRPKSGKRNRAS